MSNVAAAANRPHVTLGKSDAVTLAAKHVNISLAPAAHEACPAKLVYHPVASGKLRLGRQVNIETPDGSHMWVITVDAESGALLDKFDRVVSGTQRTANGGPAETTAERRRPHEGRTAA